jgi:hypothetical protein
VARYVPEGIVCRERAEEGAAGTPVYFKQAVQIGGEAGGWTKVEVGARECFLRPEDVERMHTKPVMCLEPRGETAPMPLAALVGGTLPEAKGHRAVGLLFPTFYNVADERFHPREEGEAGVLLRDGDGGEIARVSHGFRKAVMYEGTGRLLDGRVVNVGATVKGERRFVVLPAGSFGVGIGGFDLYPYRSAAVDFDWLCEALSGEGCEAGNAKVNRKALAGTLLYIPRLAGAGFAGGDKHDGYVCAVDVGGGIRRDRIDLFVGADGGGNPYYPACRRENPWTAAGVESLVPWDWRKFRQNGKGEWEREEATEYRTVAAAKGLEVFVVPGVKCRKEAEVKR